MVRRERWTVYDNGVENSSLQVHNMKAESAQMTASLKIDPDTHQRLRMLAITTKRKIGELANELINRGLDSMATHKPAKAKV
jgi:hypothetical protein